MLWVRSEVIELSKSGPGARARVFISVLCEPLLSGVVIHKESKWDPDRFWAG